jgi:DNA-binding NarL/FixJ family response regulator
MTVAISAENSGLGVGADSMPKRDERRRIRILCVDDHEVVRHGIALMLGQQPDMEIVAFGTNGAHAIEQFRKYKPDIVLMDLELPLMSGIEAIKAIRAQQSDARIIVLTVHHGDEDMHRAFDAGAVAYLLKETLTDDLIRVVREVHSGKRPPLSGVVAEKLEARKHQPSLSPRELDVIELLGVGMRNKEIAATLHISEVHIRSIFSKLKVHDRTAALAVALRRGLIRSY